jgi:hypothetical protein
MLKVLHTDERDAWLKCVTDPEICADASLPLHPAAPFANRDDGPGLIQASD